MMPAGDQLAFEREDVNVLEKTKTENVANFKKGSNDGACQLFLDEPVRNHTAKVREAATATSSKQRNSHH
jgi:hypothetical protein